MQCLVRMRWLASGMHTNKISVFLIESCCSNQRSWKQFFFFFFFFSSSSFSSSSCPFPSTSTKSLLPLLLVEYIFHSSSFYTFISDFVHHLAFSSPQLNISYITFMLPPILVTFAAFIYIRLMSLAVFISSYAAHFLSILLPYISYSSS